MTYYSIVSSDEYLGSNEVHALLEGGGRWTIFSLRKSINGGVFSNLHVNLGLTRIQAFSIFWPVILILRKITSNEEVFIIADGLLAYIISKIIRVLLPQSKVIMMVHNDYSLNNRTRWNFVPGWLFNFIYRILLNNEKIVTTSHAAKVALELLGHSKVYNIDNIVMKEELPSELLPHPNSWYIGRLVRAKNVEALLNVYSEIPGKNINIVGNGDQLETLIKSFSLPNIKFYGFRKDPFNLVNLGDVFILPSYIEGRSLSLMRAASKGMLLILSNIDENKFVGHLPGVWFFSPDSPLELAKCCNYVFNLRASKRRELALKNSEGMNDMLNVDDYINKYREIFDE
jgi:glycosyltransferase involved in cell wall biosynthesis